MNKRIVVTGVVSNNSPDWLHEDIYNGIDIDYEYTVLNWKKYGYSSKQDAIEHFESMDSTILIGFKRLRKTEKNLNLAWYIVGNKLYGPDPNAEYSAIVGETYCQVVKSTHAQECLFCSPCYPGQGNLDDPGNQCLAYSLPPDVWGENKPADLIEL